MPIILLPGMKLSLSIVGNYNRERLEKSSLPEHLPQKEVIFILKTDMPEERREVVPHARKEVIDREVDLESVDTATPDHEVHIQMMTVMRPHQKSEVIVITIVVIDIAIDRRDKKRRVTIQEVIVDVSLMRLTMTDPAEIMTDLTTDLARTDHPGVLVMIISGCQDVDKRIIMGDWDMMRVWKM